MIRSSGILLHVSSLPSEYGIGDFGENAYKFADFLSQANQNLWQILPLNPTNVFCGNSPYSSVSSMAIDPLFISPTSLLQDGFINKDDISTIAKFSLDKVDYSKVGSYKEKIYSLAYKKFLSRKKNSSYEEFINQNAYWLNDYAKFIAFKRYFNGQGWVSWPQEIRDRDIAAIKLLEEKLYYQIEQEKFLQYLCFLQWRQLKRYCNDHGIKIIGDIPIYVSFDSVDVWSKPELFKLDSNKKPEFVSGVPPDYFSKTGQLWGNPVYRWDMLEQTNFNWWINRFQHNLSLFDIVRIDHFRGLVAYWEVAADQNTAVNGHWVNVPVDKLFTTLLQKIPKESIIAEDLGVITTDVKEVMKKFDFPGMKILLFAFNGDLATHPYILHNHIQHCLLYTGTHDNNTVLGWYKNEANDKEKKQLADYLGKKIILKDVNWDMVRLSMMSVADKVITPLQDFLGLDEKARMNIPGVAQGNWQWRVRAAELSDTLALKIKELTKIYGRG